MDGKIKKKTHRKRLKNAKLMNFSAAVNLKERKVVLIFSIKCLSEYY